MDPHEYETHEIRSSDKQPITVSCQLMDAHELQLTKTEIQFFYDVLMRRHMYIPTECPLGHPWSDWMQDSINKLKPYVSRTHEVPSHP